MFVYKGQVYEIGKQYDARIAEMYKDYAGTYVPSLGLKNLHPMKIQYLFFAGSQDIPGLDTNILVFSDGDTIEMMHCGDFYRSFRIRNARQYGANKRASFRQNFQLNFHPDREVAIYKEQPYRTHDSLWYNIIMDHHGTPLNELIPIVQDSVRIRPIDMWKSMEPSVAFRQSNDADIFKAFKGVVLKIYAPKNYNKVTGDFEVNVSIRMTLYEIQIAWLRANKDKLVNFVINRIQTKYPSFMEKIKTLNIYKLSDITLLRSSTIELKFSIKDELKELIGEEKREE